MYRVPITRLVSIAILSVTFLMQCGTENVAGNGTLTGNPTITGYLYTSDGNTPARNAVVTIRPRTALADTSTWLSAGTTGLGLGKRLADTATVATDDSGRFVFDSTLDTGLYVIEANQGDTGLALIDSVHIVDLDSTVEVADTLRPAGSITGAIVLTEGGDVRKVFILAFGINRFTVPDAGGVFTFDSLAEAAYDLRIISSLDDYGVLDTIGVAVVAADTTDLDTIELPFEGIPTVKGLELSYDTLLQIVTLSWDKADTALVGGYNVYRKNVDSNSVAVRINTSPVTDTIYRDSTGVQDQTYEYKVTAVDKQGNEGKLGSGVSVKAVGAFVLIDSLNLGYGTGNSEIIYNGDSLLAIRTNDKITVIDTALNVLSTFDLPTNFGNGTGLLIGRLNRVWASNYSTGQVNVYDLDGALIDSIRDTAINYPTVLREDSIGRFFINTSIGANINEIRIYNDSVAFISLFPNNSNTIKTNVDDMLFDKADNMAILNRIDSTVTVYDSLGNTIKSGKLKSYTVEIEQMSNGYYIVKQDGNAGTINVLDGNFKLISIFGTGMGIDYRDFGTLAIDNFDRLFVRRGDQVLLYKIAK